MATVGSAAETVSTFRPTLGRALRTLRMRRGLSQERLTRLVEPYLSRNQLIRIEKGEPTSTATIERLLTAMGYTSADLITELSTTRVKRHGGPRTSVVVPTQAPLVGVAR